MEHTLEPVAFLPAARECLAVRDSSVHCQIETDFRTIEYLRKDWDQAALELGAPVCMTFDWLKTWWEQYGEGAVLRIFLFWSGPRLRCMLPVYLETFGVSRLQTVVARIVGANLPPRRFDPPVDSTCAQEVFAQVYHQLFAVDGCDLLSFGPVSEAWPAWPALFGAAVGANGRPLAAVSSRVTEVNVVFGLFGDFAKKLTSGKTAKHYLRELERRGGITTDVISAPEDLESCFEMFAKQHAEQWRLVGKGGHYAAWPRAHAFHRALIECQGRLGRVRFYRILAAGEMIACCYAYTWGTTLSWEMPSRIVGAEWDRVGLGKAAFIRMCQSALTTELSSVDAGLGNYAYKANLGGTMVPVRTARVVPCRWPGRVKCTLFLVVATIIKVIYHKIWYRRILHRLPEWVGRSQSRFSLRFEV